MLKYISYLSTIMRVFTIIGCWILCNVFSASIEMVIWLLSFLLLIWYISGKLLQYSCWENPMDRAWLAIVHSNKESNMTEWLITHTHTHTPHIDLTENIELTMHPWNKFYLIVVYNLFHALLNSFWYFIEGFCIYIPQRH